MNAVLKFSAAAMIGTLAMASSASAIIINGSCGSVSGPTELNGSFSCTMFDSDLGTLNSVTLTIDGSITGDIGLTNTAADARTTSATSSASFIAGALAGFSLPNPLFTPSFGTGSQTILSGQTVTFLGLTGGGSTGPLLNNSILAPYEAAGGGNFSISVETLSGVSIVGGGGQISSSFATNASATATVVYDYSVNNQNVPEPASMAILGMSMLTLGMARRRR